MGTKDSAGHNDTSFARVPVTSNGQESKKVQVSSASNLTLMGLEFHSIWSVNRAAEAPPTMKKS